MSEDGGLIGSAAVAEAGRSHLNRILGLLKDLGGKTSPIDVLEEDHYRIREGYHNFRLEEVEHQSPNTDFRQLGRPEDLEFRYFARTMQRTQLIGHFVCRGFEVPVHYAITSAIILERVDRKFRVWGRPALRNNVLLPFRFVTRPEVLERFKSDELLHLVDTGGERAEYTQLRISGVKKAYELTNLQRDQLMAEWCQQKTDPRFVLALSGMVADVPNDKVPLNCVGLAREVYVPWQNAEMLESQLLIPAYQRGQVLKSVNTSGADPMPKYTWFVRLRASSKADPEFGLLRCTCLAPSDQDAIRRADAFSARLIDERLPVTFPAEGWDRLLFPMKLCREYLESLVPTQDTVKSYFARE